MTVLDRTQLRMTTDVKIDRLEQLRKGNSFKYRGIFWEVRDCKSYKSVTGDRTTEWLIRSNSGKKYYLLQEVSAEAEQASEDCAHWYLAEQLKNPIIFIPSSYGIFYSYGIFLWDLWSAMQKECEPYPQLNVNSKLFAFESKTVESVQEEYTEQSRIIWDYWDSDRYWNLGLEAWQEEGEIELYLTHRVNPTEFSDFHEYFFNNSSEAWQFRVAVILAIVGILLMFFG